MRILIALFLFFLPALLLAQDKLTALQADKITFERFMQQDWDNLIKTANSALDQGIDFYLLRYRLAIAYYNQGKYQEAYRYFLSVYQSDNQSDSVLNEYLYFTSLFTRRFDVAQLFSTKIPAVSKKKYHIKSETLLNDIQITGIYTFNPEKEVNMRNILTENNAFYSAVSWLLYFYEYDFRVGLNVSGKVNTTVHFSDFTQINQQFIDNSKYSSSTSMQLKQKSADVISTCRLTARDKIESGINYFSGNYPTATLLTDSHFLPFTKSRQIKYKGGAAHLSYHHHFIYGEIGIAAGFNSLSENRFSTVGISSAVFLTQRRNVAIHCNIYRQSAFDTNTQTDSVLVRILISPGVMLHIKNFQFNVSGYIGKLNQFYDPFNHLVFNSNDPYCNYISISLLASLKNIVLTAGYATGNKETNQYIYSLDNPGGSLIKKYSFNSLWGGIQWIF